MSLGLSRGRRANTTLRDRSRGAGHKNGVWRVHGSIRRQFRLSDDDRGGVIKNRACSGSIGALSSLELSDENDLRNHQSLCVL